VYLSETALPTCMTLQEQASTLKVRRQQHPSGTRLLDCGVHSPGGLEAGRLLAEMCLAGRGSVQLVPGRPSLWRGPAVMVRTDQPVAACLASQYAGWKISTADYFAIGSGPMRAAYGGEELFDHIHFRERPQWTCGVLEASALPPDDLCADLAEKCGVAPSKLTLAVAPTSSLAGSFQVVARSVETALHKLHELQFDVGRIASAWGLAPLAPVAADDLTAIGRTNDAILYGGEVTLWVTGEDESICRIGPQAPSSASRDFGQPFRKVFEQYEFDFYRIDPMLFSPAVLTFNNLDTGRSFQFGELRPDLIAQSFDLGSSDQVRGDDNGAPG
jgi:methenyltetrahydromethanopterin cyclohydrolase